MVNNNSYKKGYAEMKNSTKGFTLAEVLITLGIIGVVAALTIPLLVESYQKQATVEKLKKVYTTFLQAAELATVDYGSTSSWYDSSNPLNEIDFSNKYLVPYLNIAKNCERLTTSDCYYVSHKLKTGDTTDTYEFDNNSNAVRLYLSDGSLLNIGKPDSSQFKVLIDINGAGPPNIFGKDEFYYRFYFATGKLIPNGYNTGSKQAALTDSNYGCNKSASGIYCAAVIMFDNWQISSDYPW